MAIVSALRSLSLNRAFSALLTLMVLLHGTLLAPQLVMGPECNAFEGIASSAHRDFISDYFGVVEAHILNYNGLH